MSCAAIAAAGVLALSSPVALAEAPPAPAVTLVKLMPATGQALLFDKSAREYVLVRAGDPVGDPLQGYLVKRIEKDQIVLGSERAPKWFFVLALPSDDAAVDGGDRGARTRSVSRRTAHTTIPAPSDSEVLDPYGQPATTGGAAAPPTGSSENDLDLVDPYAPASGKSEKPVRTVTAPPAARVGRKPTGSSAGASTAAATGSAAAGAASSAATGAAGTAGAAAAGAIGSVASTGSGAATSSDNPPAVAEPAEPGPSEESYKVSRKELDAALSDFHALRKEIRIKVLDNGIKLTRVPRRSLAHRLGLRSGDIVLRVAGHPVTSAEGAADAYVAVTAADQFEISARRGGAPLILRYEVTD